MKTLSIVAFALLLFGLGVVFGPRLQSLPGLPSWLSLSPSSPDDDVATPSPGRKPLFYRHPMNPTISSPVPAKDDMGMDYIAVYADEDTAGADAGLVKISPVMVNNLGVRTEKVERSTLARLIETVGYIDYDERLISHVHLRIAGWVDELQVKAVGERVRKGDLLFRVYSPELVNAQEEYLQAMQMNNPSLLNASRNRLRALGIPDNHIARLSKGKRSGDLTAIYARQDGVAASLDVREGMYVMPATRVMTLADLSSVWVLVHVFENQADWVAVGQKAEVRLPYLPGEGWEGEVEFVYPMLDPKTRTLRARLRFPNPDERLKPNMYANVTIHASPREDILTIPQQALIRTGASQRVIVDRGEGRFAAVEVQPGIESGERIEIVSGLEENDIVVVSAQFLIDSEASLKASLRRMSELATQEPAAVWAEGLVNTIQTEPPTVNLSHGPIPEIGWPEMTMDFPVDDALTIDKFETGAKVRFALRQGTDGRYVISAIAPAAK